MIMGTKLMLKSKRKQFQIQKNKNNILPYEVYGLYDNKWQLLHCFISKKQARNYIINFRNELKTNSSATIFKFPNDILNVFVIENLNFFENENYENGIFNKYHVFHTYGGTKENNNVFYYALSYDGIFLSEPLDEFEIRKYFLELFYCPSIKLKFHYLI